MNLAVEKAREASVGLVTVHRCNHVARLGGFASMAAAQGMVGMISCNGHSADLAMAPWGGIGRMIPANCLAVAFPSGRDFPVLLDLTTAVAAGGKVRVKLAQGERLPEGWVIDAAGNSSTDPEDYVSRQGALLPFGGPVAHKGYGLAFVLDVLSGALSPAGCSMADSPVTGNALFVQAILIDAFRPLATFEAEVGRFIDHLKSASPAPGFDEVLVPGERSHRTRLKRLEEGIPIAEATWERICGKARELGISVE